MDAAASTALAGTRIDYAPSIQWQGHVWQPQDGQQKTAMDATLRRFLKKYHVVRMPVLPREVKHARQWPESWNLHLDLGGNSWDLELESSPLGLENMAVGPRSAWYCYRGRVKGRENSQVRLTLDEQGLTGYIISDGKKTFVEPARNLFKAAVAGALVAYSDADVVQSEEVRCGVVTSASASQSDLGLPKEAVGQATQIRPCALVELAVAAHGNMLAAYGGVDGVKKRVSEVVNMVDGLYQDTGINLKIRISEFYIDSAGANSFGETLVINDLLTRLLSWGVGSTGFKKTFDVSTLWYYDPGSGVVGLAVGGGGVNTGVVCRRNQNGNVIRDFTKSSYTMMLDQAHELGHNFGAPHISDATLIMNPSITGKNDQWGDSTRNTINAYRARITCLGACDIPPVSRFAVSSGCGATRAFTDQSLGEPTAWQWDFGDGSGSTERNPSHHYAQDGKYSVSLITSNAYGKDTVLAGDAVTVKNLPPPIPVNAEYCGTQVTLKASASGNMNWWDAPSGGNKLAEGDSLRTPVLTAKTIYYVDNAEAGGASQKVGPVTRDFGTGGYFNSNDLRRTFFDVYGDLRLKSAKVYASGAGNRTIQLLDKNEKVLVEKNVLLPNGESRVILDMDIPKGDAYAIKLAGSGAALNLYRNQTGAAYPYEIDGLISVTGTDASDNNGTVGYYYYFYDWEVQAAPCASDRVAVTVNTLCSNAISLHAQEAEREGLYPLGGSLYRFGMPWSEAGRVEVSVFSALGQVVARKEMTVEKGWVQGQLRIDASHVQGLVIVRVSGQNGQKRYLTAMP